MIKKKDFLVIYTDFLNDILRECLALLTLLSRALRTSRAFENYVCINLNPPKEDDIIDTGKW